MRKQIVAGNWKMNKTESETTQLIEVLQQQDLMRGVEVFVAPTFVNLSAAVKATKDSGIHVAAQNVHQSASGAFTGEISSAMLLDIGVQHVILGHSERLTKKLKKISRVVFSVVFEYDNGVWTNFVYNIVIAN